MLTMMVVDKPPTSFDEGLAKEPNMNGHIGKPKNDTNDVKSASASASAGEDEASQPKQHIKKVVQISSLSVAVEEGKSSNNV
jgi:hypothetical protein